MLSKHKRLLVREARAAHYCQKMVNWSASTPYKTRPRKQSTSRFQWLMFGAFSTPRIMCCPQTLLQMIVKERSYLTDAITEHGLYAKRIFKLHSDGRRCILF